MLNALAVITHSTLSDLKSFEEFFSSQSCESWVLPTHPFVCHNMDNRRREKGVHFTDRRWSTASLGMAVLNNFNLEAQHILLGIQIYE
jgi:hypothetical protein